MKQFAIIFGAFLCIVACRSRKVTFNADQSAFATTYFEAESFTSKTGESKASTEYFPYIGEGYLEMGGQGSSVKWDSITAPKSGKYTLLLKYSNNTYKELPCDLKVNGTFVKSIPFGPFPKNWDGRPEATEYNPETVGWAKYWNARVIVDLQAGANALELMATSADGGPHIDNIGVSTAISTPPTPVINVKDYGAVPDGSTDNTRAIAEAIAACPEGGSVVFDEGIYMTGSITLKANMTFWISENAIVRAFQDSSKMESYFDGRYEGNYFDYFPKYFLFGNQVDNLTITGGGAIDGNTVGSYRVDPKRMRSVLLGFINSKNIKVTNVDLLYADSWLFVPQKSDSIIIDGINLHTTHKDGIAPIDCNDVYLTNSTISCGDDAIVPKSYDSSMGLDNLQVRNVTINHTKWKGFKYGASTKGNFTNSIIEDIAMVYTHSGIALYSTSGCDVTNIKLNRIKMNNPQTPFFILRSASGSKSDIGMRDIYISNIEVRNVYSRQGSSIQGTAKDGVVYPVKNIYFTNVDVQSFKGGMDEVPEMPPEFPGVRPRISGGFPDGYPETIVWDEFPAWGYFIRHAENVVFENVTHSVSPEDAREDIVLEDVKGFEIVKRDVTDNNGQGNATNSINKETTSFVAIGDNAVADTITGDNPVIRLWTIEQIGGEQNRLKHEVTNRGRIRYENVKDPHLVVYQAQSSKPTRSVIYCPGGGYHHLTPRSELIKWLNDLGITVFMLKYTVPHEREAALRDVQRAMRVVRYNSKKWNINPDQLGVIGSSAGGHLVARLSHNYKTPAYEPIDAADQKSCEPAFVMLTWAAYLQEKGSEVKLAKEFHMKNKVAPTFLVYAKDDKFSTGGIAYEKALKSTGTLTHLELYEIGGHGLKDIDWYPVCEEWLKDIQNMDTPERKPFGNQ